MKVLITSPSFDTAENVSGISTYAVTVVEHSANDFVHFTAGKKDDDAGGLRWVSRQARLPFKFLSKLRSVKPDIVHVNTAMETRAIIRDAILVEIAKFKNIPVVLHIHGGRFLREPLGNAAVAAATRRMLGSATKIIVLSETERGSISAQGPALDVGILPNAIETARVPEFERSNDRPVVLFFGRIHESKGLGDIVEACKTLKQQGFRFRFNCYGTGPDKYSFNAAMTDAIGDSYYYGGIAAGSGKWSAFGGSDIFLLPSNYEGLPMALLEAMAAGCIPVVSGVGAIPTVVEDGYNGFLVKPGDLVQLIGRLKVLLSDGTGWERLRANARETIRERFDISRHIRELEDIYANAAKDK